MPYPPGETNLGIRSLSGQLRRVGIPLGKACSGRWVFFILALPLLCRIWATAREYGLGIIYSVQLLATSIIDVYSRSGWLLQLASTCIGELSSSQQEQSGASTNTKQQGQYVPRPNPDSSLSPFPRGKLGGDRERQKLPSAASGPSKPAMVANKLGGLCDIARTMLFTMLFSKK